MGGKTTLEPGRARAELHPRGCSQADEVNLALDGLRDQGAEALLLLSHGEPLYDQLARQGQLDQLERWQNLSVERIPSRDHMFRTFALQRYVHKSLDRALERVLGVCAQRT